MSGWVTNFLYFNSKGCKGYVPKKLPLFSINHKSKIKSCQIILSSSKKCYREAEFQYCSILWLVDLPSRLTQTMNKKCFLTKYWPKLKDSLGVGTFQNADMFHFRRSVNDRWRITQWYKKINRSSSSVLSVIHRMSCEQLVFFLKSCIY